MAEVISLAAHREENTPHWSGQCVCLGCRHEWEGVGPMGATISLECPSCSLPKGVIKNLFGAQAGDAVLLCNCGSEALTAYKRHGHKWLRCMACGTDQTNTLFDG